MYLTICPLTPSPVLFLTLSPNLLTTPPYLPLQIESGTLRLEFSAVAIWQVVKKTTAGFAMQAREKNVTLIITGAIWDELCAQELMQYQALQVVGDSMFISQVLRNLMSNAIKFTPTSGSISVHVEWLPEALADAQIDNLSLEESQQWFSYARAGAVRVSVTETGAGLSPERLLEIGEEGVQFNANQLQAGQGSGLGLFISKGIAQQVRLPACLPPCLSVCLSICLSICFCTTYPNTTTPPPQHGGTFEVTSEGLDRGTTFSVLLPLFCISDVGEQEQEADPNTVNFNLPPQDTATAVVEKMPQRLLIVDDALSNRKMLLRIL
jgi:hypothetical protein